jgi:hypothetical protein
VKVNWKGIILWSNQFYGLCAVLLSIETSLILLDTYPNPFLLLLIYLGTIVYYTHAYLQEGKLGEQNERVGWYQKNHRYLIIRQVVFTFLCLLIAFVKLQMLSALIHASLFVKFVILISGLLSAAYYMPNLKFGLLHSYRTNGVVKSMAIAWVWTFTCCFVPIWLGSNSQIAVFNEKFNIYFLLLFIYVLVLAILFDIKDMLKDQLEQVNTIALKMGAERTVRYIVCPLLMLYYIIIIYWVWLAGLSPIFILIQGLFVALSYLIARRVLTQKAIFVNILLIDGLLVLKAVISIAFILKT